jgi:hypothetical protein
VVVEILDLLQEVHNSGCLKVQLSQEEFQVDKVKLLVVELEDNNSLDRRWPLEALNSLLNLIQVTGFLVDREMNKRVKDLCQLVQKIEVVQQNLKIDLEHLQTIHIQKVYNEH